MHRSHTGHPSHYNLILLTNDASLLVYCLSLELRIAEDGGYSTMHQMLYTTLQPPSGAHCAWSRNLDSNLCPSQGLNLGPITWQSSTQPLDHHTSQHGNKCCKDQNSDKHRGHT